MLFHALFFSTLSPNGVETHSTEHQAAKGVFVVMFKSMSSIIRPSIKRTRSSSARSLQQKTAQFTQTEALLLSLPMARACAPSVLPSCLVLDENRSSKSISDAPSEPRNQAVFVQISFPRRARLPAIKQWSHSTLEGVFLRGQASGRKRAKRKSLISWGLLAGC